jgi:PAS domain S-box-containing protein
MNIDNATGRSNADWLRIASRYMLSLATVALAVLSRRWLVSSFGPMPLFITFYPAVLFVAATAGGGPGIAATILSSLAAMYWFIEPYGSFGIQAPNDAIALGIFCGMSFVLCVLLERARRLLQTESVKKAQEQELALLDMGNLVNLDLDRRIVHWSTGCHRLYEYNSEEAQGRRVDDLLKTRFSQPEDQIQRNLIALNYWEGEVTRRRKDGTELSLVILLALRRDENGKPEAILEVSTDITPLKEAERSIRDSEEHHRDILRTAMDGVILTDPKGRLMEVNEAYCRMSGYTAQELQTMCIADLADVETADAVATRFRNIIERGETRYEAKHCRKDGTTYDLEISAKFRPSKGGNFVFFVRDITERKRLEETQQFLLKCGLHGQNEDLFALLARYLAETLKMDFVCIDRLLDDQLTAETVAVYFDGNFEDNISYTLHDTPCGAVVGQTVCSFPHDVRHIYPNDTVLQEMLAESYVGTTLWGSQGKPIGLIAVIGRRALADTSLAEAVLKVVSIKAASELERRQVDKEKAEIEAQLSQAQKMESVGRLAGGIAHDFNNMLTVILGHSQLALMKTDQSHPLYAHLEEIRCATDRSADLTRQLLAFARKQIIEPRVLDLNATVASMLKMLKRLIGEGVDLAWKPSEDLWPVKLDPAQVDQILANLCVNARDSITDVGKITIETGNTSIDDNYCALHLGFNPGEYVHLIVSDNGHGMDKETLSHIFEPFFTTKGVGEGTGLGLSTVYGAVKQNNGFVNVYSEPGSGTRFSIYLPKHTGIDEKVQAKDITQPALATQGDEHILLVEDEPAILNITTSILTKLGYTVLAADSPREAIRIAEEYVGEIHLLITDVIMPEMNGRELAQNLRLLHPKFKSMFMSGYTANVIAHHGVLDDGVHFIQKPFSVPALAAKVRDVLDSEKECL